MTNTQKLVEELTNENNHTDALIVECLELARYDLIQDLAVIADIHNQAGFMTKEMQDKRSEIEKRMLNGN